MIAGTVLVFGQPGNRPAAGMRRGTVGLLGTNPPPLLMTFRKNCVCKPPVLRLMLRTCSHSVLECRVIVGMRTMPSTTAIA
jgi:formylmethanofuran dehydrogenase subunit C